MKLLLLASHIGALAIGFAIGIYALPILIAAPAPDATVLQSVEQQAVLTGEFSRDRIDSDGLHWGEGRMTVSENAVAFRGELAPGPDYRLYFSPSFIETEAEFLQLKSSMVQVGAVNTFGDFMLPIPKSVDPTQYSAAIVWCETFGEFISSAKLVAGSNGGQ